MEFVSVRYCSFVFDGRSRRTHYRTQYRTHHIRCPRSPIFSCGTNDRWHSFVFATDRWHSSMFVKTCRRNQQIWWSRVQSLCIIMKRIFEMLVCGHCCYFVFDGVFYLCVIVQHSRRANENLAGCPIMSVFRLKGERQMTCLAQARSCSPPMAGIR